MKDIITLELLQHCYIPDFENGKLYFREMPLSGFLPDKVQRSINKKAKNKVQAFTSVGVNRPNCSYYMGKIPTLKTMKYRHRILLMLYHQTVDIGICDHKNGNGLDCRISNLKVSTQGDNLKNRKPSIRKTPYGVTIHKNIHCYRVTVYSERKIVYRETFKSHIDALEASIKNMLLHGYSDRHVAGNVSLLNELIQQKNNEVISEPFYKEELV